MTSHPADAQRRRRVRDHARAWLVALLLGAPAAARAEGSAVADVAVEGNTRTTTAYIKRTLGVEPGDRIDAASLPSLEQRLMNARLFEWVRLRLDDADAERAVLRVVVKERWTLVPFPVFAASRGNAGGGLFVREANLFGRGKQLGLGGIVSTKGTSFSVGYRDPGVWGTPLLFTLELARIDLTREQDDGTATLYQFQDRRYEYGSTVGWQLTQRLAVRGGYFAILADEAPADGFAPPPRAAPVRGLSGEVELNAQDYHLHYVTGLVARVRYRQGVSWLRTARDLEQESAVVSWSSRVLADHALSLTAAFDRAHGDPVVDALRLGGRPGSRGFVVGGLWAETAGTFSAEYQVPVWRPSWGVLAGAAFLDAGLTRWKGAETNYVAPGVGVRLYLRGVAVPALGVDVAQATGVGSPAVSFAAGFRL